MEAVETEHQQTRVYHIYVEDLHNYSVGNGEWLVHNGHTTRDSKTGRFISDPANPPRPKPPKTDHGNTLGSQPATLYKKYDKNGNFLKHGMSQDPSTRYPKYGNNGLNGGYLINGPTGPRDMIAQMERELVERLPGPDNFEPWAGSRLGE